MLSEEIIFVFVFQTISWEPPKKANGKLTIYVIKVTLAYDDEQLLDQRNYCDERMSMLNNFIYKKMRN